MKKDPNLKFKISLLGMLVASLVPLVYKNMNITDSVTMEVLAIIASLATVFSGLHVLDKRMNGK